MKLSKIAINLPTEERYFMQKWFQSWFDSPYYHILYKDRDNQEAEYFMDNLLEQIHLPVKSSVLDIACGKGRHSLFLADKGYHVTGIDLSEQSIAYCKQFERQSLEFYVHDMREIFRTNCYDVALNLFTSFGYFNSDHDNRLALRTASLALKPGGYFILDFFNPDFIKNTSQQHIKQVDGIDFSINKHSDGNTIEKTIQFSDSGKSFKFTESVQIISKHTFLKHFERVGLVTRHIFGDYSLRPFEEDSSERMIFITQKPQ